MEVGSVSDIKVRIYGEFNDKAFKKASKATSGLESSFKKLGGAIIAAFSVQQIVAFGKASLKAFEDDQKAAARLAQTLKNLGLGFEDPRIESYISNLERTSGVLDDKLRPALQSLLTATGSVTTSQQLLSTAIDVSRGSGEDLVSVANDLAQAYVGNTKGLKKYNLGLTQAELKGKSFSDLMTIINKQFAGQNAAYLDTYAGKMDTLNVAFANAQETIGKGLADAFSILAGDQGIGGAAKAMADFSQQVSDAIVGIADMLSLINQLPGMDQWKLFDLGNIPVAGAWLEFFASQGAKARIAPKPFQVPMTISGQTDLYAKQDAARKKAEEEAAKRAKALAALQAKTAKDQAAKEKATQQLKRAGTVFDMENIQIVAALQGKVTEEQRLRLLALLAINNDMADAADKLTQAILAVQSPAFNMLGITISTSDNATTVVEKLIKAQTQLFLLAGGIKDIPKAKNPFEDWDSVMKAIIGNLDTIAKKIKELPKVATDGAAVGGTTGNSGTGGSNSGNSGVGGSTGNTGIGGTGLSGAAAAAASVGVFAPTGEGFASLGSDVNLLATARYTAMQQDIQSTQTLTNNLAAARYEAMYQAIKTQNQQTNDLAAARYAAMQQYYAPSTPTVVVNVAGNVTTERDLVTSITDSLYEFQRSGGDIRLSAVAI